jgi:flagellar M-ring protein FliF
VEDSKPATASIQVDLRHSLPSAKLAAIVHLVASAVEGLDPESVTVVDTRGRTIFRGGGSEEAAAMLSSTQLEYKRKIEEKIRKNVQSLLEGIAGRGKALVRVSAQVDFTKTTVNEEEYDPFTTAVRSKRDMEESVDRGGRTAETGGTVAETSDVVGPNAVGMAKRKKKDVTTNYEINKTTRSILRPAGKVTRLSVAAVIDGTYELEELKGGSVKRTYVPRSDAELAEFEEIVKGAVGYDADREDRISVSSMAFARTIPQGKLDEGGKTEETNILQLCWKNRKVIINLFLVVLVFLLVVRPLVKSMRKMIREAPVEKQSLTATGEDYTRLAEQPKWMNPKEKALELSRNRPERAQQLIKQWVEEG